MKVLALNAGSNSLKFEVVDVGSNTQGELGRTLLRASYDDIGKEKGTFSLFQGKGVARKDPVHVASYSEAAEKALDWLASGEAQAQGIPNLEAIERIGHRVVHGADLFTGPARINNDTLRKIEELQELAPLHNSSALEVIRTVEERLGERVPAIAVFDTEFHKTIPEVAAAYALPVDLAARHRIRRYGFHGVSHRYMLLRYQHLTGRSAEKLITLHLEGGSSACAIRSGKSVDTSMGFTPLEGLVMGTRSGDLDPAIVPYLMRREGWDANAAEEFLNKKCGLQGVSGLSNDTRELAKHTDEKNVRLALDLFAYRVRKYIGSYLAVLGGAEAIVFGGGIGENSPDIRAAIVEGLEALGIHLDRAANRDAVDHEAIISSPKSDIELRVIPTEEALMVAYEAAQASA